MYLFIASAKSRSASPHVEGCCITVVHGWTGFYSATSLTFRQTRYQALYTDIQRLIADTASILCRVQRMPSMASAEHEFACCKLTALTGCQWFHAVSSYVNLQHPCCKLTCEFCKSKTSFLPNTPAIHGGTEQNSKQPNVHGCTFGCDGILGGSEYIPPCTRLNDKFFYRKTCYCMELATSMLLLN